MHTQLFPASDRLLLGNINLKAMYFGIRIAVDDPQVQVG
ncbi:hypothetical protein OROMI_004904 [Orobanche minor]